MIAPPTIQSCSKLLAKQILICRSCVRRHAVAICTSRGAAKLPLFKKGEKIIKWSRYFSWRVSECFWLRLRRWLYPPFLTWNGLRPKREVHRDRANASRSWCGETARGVTEPFNAEPASVDNSAVVLVVPGRPSESPRQSSADMSLAMRLGSRCMCRVAHRFIRPHTLSTRFAPRRSSHGAGFPHARRNNAARVVLWRYGALDFAPQP
jgi:hypothetical protein